MLISRNKAMPNRNKTAPENMKMFARAIEKNDGMTP